jgi:hypothetical protein
MLAASAQVWLRLGQLHQNLSIGSMPCLVLLAEMAQPQPQQVGLNPQLALVALLYKHCNALLTCCTPPGHQLLRG